MEKVSENVGTARIDTRNGGSMNLKFWDKKARLIAAFSDLTVDEAREIIKAAKKGFTLTRVGSRKRKAKEVRENAE